MNGRGAHAQTLSGGIWYPFSPRPEEVRFADQFAAARLPRYGCHTKRGVDRYVVMHHEVLVCRLLRAWGEPLITQACGLFHDQGEIYTPGDQIGPMLRGSHPFSVAAKALADEQQRCVNQRFGLPWPYPEHIAKPVKLADAVLLSTERRDLMADSDVDWGHMLEPLPERIEPWEPERAWREWIAELYAVGMGRIVELA